MSERESITDGLEKLPDAEWDPENENEKFFRERQHLFTKKIDPNTGTVMYVQIGSMRNRALEVLDNDSTEGKNPDA